MVLWILGALTIVGLIYVGIAAIRDPESGLYAEALPKLIEPKSALLNPLQAEVFQLLHETLIYAGYHVFPNVPMNTAFDVGRLTPTGWHRMRHELVDFLIVRADFAPVAVLLIETGEQSDYLEKENREMKKSAIAEAGVPLLKLFVTPDKPLGASAEDVLTWVQSVVIRPHSLGKSTQVDLL